MVTPTLTPMPTVTPTPSPAASPMAVADAANVTMGGSATYTFTVAYSDDVAINVATLDGNDVRVNGPNGFDVTAVFTGVDNPTNGSPRFATYSVTTPGGSWDLSDNGTYNVAMQPNQVSDTSGNFVAAGNIGSFNVKIGASTPTPTPTPPVTPTPTVTPAPTLTPQPTVTPTPAPTMTPQPTVTPTPVPTLTPQPTVTPTPTPTVTPTPTPIAPRIQFVSSTFIEDESQTAIITITRTGSTSATDTVTFSTTNGNATGGTACTSGVDYISVSGQSVTFDAGIETRAVNVAVCADRLVEPVSQTVNLSLAGANLGTPSTAVLTINDTATQYRTEGSIALNSSSTAEPYPSTINVTNGPSIVGSMRVTLYDLSSTAPDNIDILLVGPTGQKFILMADTGGLSPISGNLPVTLTFSDAAGAPLADTGPLATGQFEPTSWEPGQSSFPTPAPAGPYNQPGSGPGGTVVQTLTGNFGSLPANGVWSLYIRDDGNLLALVPAGNIAGGWGLEFIAPTAAGVEITGHVLDENRRGIAGAKVIVRGNSLPQPITVTTDSLGLYRVADLTAGHTYVVTVVSKYYTFTSPTHIVNLTDNIANLNFFAAAPSNEARRE